MASAGADDNLPRRGFVANRLSHRRISDRTCVEVGRFGLLPGCRDGLVLRRPVGWAQRSRMREGLVLSALKPPVSQRDVSRGALHHSDRRVQYRGSEYPEALGGPWPAAHVPPPYGRGAANAVRPLTREVMQWRLTNDSEDTGYRPCNGHRWKS